LRLPLVGRFIRESNLARFARTLALLIESGVAIDKALELSAATLHNRIMRQEIDEVRKKTVQQGATFSSGLRGTQQFPPFVANMAGVGEEAGRLEEALAEVATFYEREVTQMSRMATSLIEPLLILTVGGIVGLIVAAMLLPIFEIGSGLQ
jgi:type II secretory pathway component PulF